MCNSVWDGEDVRVCGKGMWRGNVSWGVCDGGRAAMFYSLTSSKGVLLETVPMASLLLQ